MLSANDLSSHVFLAESDYAFMGAHIPYLPVFDHLTGDTFLQEGFRRFVSLAETLATLDPLNTVAFEIANNPLKSANSSSKFPEVLLRLFLKSQRVDSGKDAYRQVQNLWHVIEQSFPAEPPFLYPLRLMSSREVNVALDNVGVASQATQFFKYIDSNLQEEITSLSFPHPYRNYPLSHHLFPVFSAIANDRKLRLWISFRSTGDRDFSEVKILYKALNQDGRNEIENQRRQFGARIVNDLMQKQSRLLDIRITLLSSSGDKSEGAIQSIRTALGAGLITFSNGVSRYINPPNTVSYTNKEESGYELAAFLKHAELLDHQPLAASKEQDTIQAAQLLQTIVTPEEVAAILTLPMPSEYTMVPGIETRLEPFAVPIEREAILRNDPKIVLGSMCELGERTKYQASIPLEKVNQHILVAGRSGSGKTNTCLVMLQGLASQKPPIPFLVLDPLDKGDYRLLLGDELLGNKLKVYTVGKEKVAPLRFNPFRIPPTVDPQRHSSQLLRCFLAAFGTWDPIPAIYRAALRETYADAELRARVPIFEDFFRILSVVVERRTQDYGKETQGTIKQATILRMGSLLEDTQEILNVDEDKDSILDEICDNPTVIELGHLGSDEDKALIMGFLLVCLLPRIQQRLASKQEQNKVHHVTLIEEAHRLMHRSGGVDNESLGNAIGQARSDFANLLAEVRGYGQGIIVVDQSPGELVSSVFANTATHIMHQVRGPQSFEMMSANFGLSSTQARYARRLQVGDAITETPSGKPIHIRIDDITRNLKDRLGVENLEGGERVKDEVIKDTDNRNEKLPKTKAHIASYETLLKKPSAPNSSQASDILPKEAQSRFCAGCLPLWKTQKCKYGDKVADFMNKESRKTSVSLKDDYLRNSFEIAHEELKDVKYCMLATSAKGLELKAVQDRSALNSLLEIKKKLVSFHSIDKRA